MYKLNSKGNYMKITFKFLLIFLIYLNLIYVLMANKSDVGSDQPSSVPVDINSNIKSSSIIIDEVNNLLTQKDFVSASKKLKTQIEQDKNNADLLNLLGYTNRKMGKFIEALSLYKQALEVHPEHTGVHNYIGYAYLNLGFIDKAEHHLLKLNLICLWGCEDYDDLASAVKKYKNNETW